MRIQDAILWLEQGRGARLLAAAAAVLAAVAFSGVLAFKQFRGPLTEETLVQAEMGRALAEGKGFTTGVRYPRVWAWRAARGEAFDRDGRDPELYHAPLYAMAIAAAWTALPDTVAAELRGPPGLAPDGYGGDYLLLGLNVALFWLAAGQTWWLARRWFEPWVAHVAAAGVMLSWPLWEHVLAVDGTALAMVVGLAMWQALTRAAAGRAAPAWWLAVGVAAGALALVDYANVAATIVVAAYVAWRRGRRAAVLVVAGVVLAMGPWLARNVVVSGHPLGLAGDGFALWAGDPTADPAAWRASLEGGSPPVSLAKVANKALSAIEATFAAGPWSAGAMVLAGFFVAAWLYRFRRDEIEQWRGLATVALLATVGLQAVIDSGEGERSALAWGAPWLMIFGAGFLRILLAGASPAVASRAGWLWAGLLAVQVAPLAQNLLEPRRAHFSFPPYYPSFFHGLGRQLAERSVQDVGWMADVPAGLSWYGGTTVWAQPRALRDFYAIQAEQPTGALLLTPATLDRPFFGGLDKAEAGAAGSRFGGWDQIYRGLVTERWPEAFPLRRRQPVASNLLLLVDDRLIGPR